MAQLTATIITLDGQFQRQIAHLLRAGGVPVGLLDEQKAGQAGATADLCVIDIRHDRPAGLATIERVRADSPTVTVFVVAGAPEPEVILQAMRAGANEFFSWANGAAQPDAATEEAFQGAVRRAASRREAAQGTRKPSEALVFVGAKGGAGTTTIAVNCGVELARLTKRPTIIVDLKACLGEVALFLGVRPRFTVLDAIENLHRLDRDFVRELVAHHKSGIDVLAGSEQFDRPGVQDAGAIEELFRVLARVYDYVIVDAGNLVSSCTVAALYAADTVFLVTNPDVASIRNSQRLVERVRQLGAGGERVRVLLNRLGDHLMIQPDQIETALGYKIHHRFRSDYASVSRALNSGIPLTLANHSEISGEFASFTSKIITPLAAQEEPEPPRSRKGGLFSFF